MKREMMKLLRQLLAENDAVERNTIKRKIMVDFPRLRFVKNDPEGEIKSKELLRSCMTSFCKDASDENRQGLVDCVSSFERLFV
ncbi:hypothetical protein [Flavobacterium selenitireducens]|uniref:hypothetical protein n=1 Tax=Flavobacterium selenitireducens TaxID=2722704 RepID=UPI00168ADC63|nr:hypothetical protein [Flavobacterium selenitireducens]MBD3581912.1 hypothetical protein [Flavobacterium selenitireducens]